jgi:hypothetical protein
MVLGVEMSQMTWRTTLTISRHFEHANLPSNEHDFWTTEGYIQILFDDQSAHIQHELIVSLGEK